MITLINMQHLLESLIFLITYSLSLSWVWHTKKAVNHYKSVIGENIINFTYTFKATKTKNMPTWPSWLTMMLSGCLSPMPRTKVATQYPAQERVKLSMAWSSLFGEIGLWWCYFENQRTEDFSIKKHHFFTLMPKDKLSFSLSSSS